MAGFGQTGTSGSGALGAYGAMGGAGGISDILQQLMAFISNPTASPLYKNSLSGLLNALAPGEALQRQNLADTFRGAGNMSSGIYGNAARNLISQQGLNRQTLASQLLASLFPQMTSALMGPLSLAASLSRSNQPGGFSGGTGWESIPPSLGLGTPMSSGGGNAVTTPGVGAPVGEAGGITLSQLMQALGLSAPSATPTPTVAHAPTMPTNPYTLPPGLNGGGGSGGLTQDLLTGMWTNQPNQSAFNPWADMEATDWGFLNPGQTEY